MGKEGGNLTRLNPQARVAPDWRRVAKQPGDLYTSTLNLLSENTQTHKNVSRPSMKLLVRKIVKSPDPTDTPWLRIKVDFDLRFRDPQKSNAR